MRKGSYAWYALNRCYHYGPREIAEINRLMKELGMTMAQAIEHLKENYPKWAMEINDTRHMLTHKEMAIEKQPQIYWRIEYAIDSMST